MAPMSVARVHPLAREPRVVVVEPSDRGREVVRRGHRVQVVVRAEDARAVRHANAGNHRAEEFRALGEVEREQSAARRVQHRVSRRLHRVAGLDLVPDDVIRDVQQELVRACRAKREKGRGDGGGCARQEGRLARAGRDPTRAGSGGRGRGGARARSFRSGRTVVDHRVASVNGGANGARRAVWRRRAPVGEEPTCRVRLGALEKRLVGSLDFAGGPRKTGPFGGLIIRRPTASAFTLGAPPRTPPRARAACALSSRSPLPRRGTREGAAARRVFPSLPFRVPRARSSRWFSPRGSPLGKRARGACCGATRSTPPRKTSRS